MSAASVSDFFTSLPAFDRFERVVESGVFQPAPGATLLALSDVEGSTAAIAEGRYKAVNFAGAAAISAIGNVVGSLDFPFVFGGDGAGALVDARDRDVVAGALSATSTFVRDELGLGLRVALVPIEAIRTAGRDVRVARFQTSPTLATAMFSGGGVAWGEAEMKTGRFQLEPAPTGTQPNLEGLSCRWDPVRARRGIILSVLVMPILESDGSRPADFETLVGKLLAMASDAGMSSNPVPVEGPATSLRPAGLEYEARATRGDLPLNKQMGKLKRLTRIAWLLDRTGWKIGGFDMRHYRRVLAANTDFRKFDDGLRMTLDCSPKLADGIERLLLGAERDGVANVGLHRQDEALMTCIVPSVTRDDHIHFLDGAGGGYAMAASNMKRKSAGMAGN